MCTVGHDSVRSVKQSQHSSQSRLSSFGSDETTYVAITQSMNDDIDDVVDEYEPALSPPDQLFYEWLHTRDAIVEQDAVPKVVAHNDALDAVNYRQRFGTYLSTDDDAQDALERLAERVCDGEEIVLVCYCHGEKWCHRTAVAETLNAMVDERCSG